MPRGTHHFRFSLTAMFGAVLFVAFGTAAIRFASPLWAGLTMSLTVLILFAAVLGAIFRVGQARARWIGLAIGGWGYLALVLPSGFENGVGQYLPTSYLLNAVHAKLQKQVWIIPPSTGGSPMGMGSGTGMPGGSMGGPDGMAGGIGSGGGVYVTGPDHSLVLRTGHALFFGYIGGVTAKWFYLTQAPHERRSCGE
jgi:hypothetical protein